MPTAVKLINDEKIFARELESYVKLLKEQSETSSEQAIKEAKKALKETGVINPNGSAKKKIVSWE